MAINVKFIGNKPLSWSAVDGADTPATDDIHRLEFREYLQKVLHDNAIQNDPHASTYSLDRKKCRAANVKKYHRALLSMTYDSSTLFSFPFSTESLGKHPDTFEAFTLLFVSRLGKILPLWERQLDVTDEDDDGSDDGKEATTEGKGKAPATTRGKKRSHSEVGRLPADKRAQSTVPTWYRQGCVLTGFPLPQGAHILPVRALHKSDTKPSDFEGILRSFWPLKDNEDPLVVRGQETRNILPLSPNAHLLWDRYYFTLRPIAHPTEPAHHLYLQMVWLKDIDEEGNLERGGKDDTGDYPERHGVADGRRRDSKNNSIPLVQHGDVLLLSTEDSVNCPLPNIRFLEIQFAVHKIMAGIFAAGSLAAIFSGDPPDGGGPTSYAIDTPCEWQSLIDAAVDAGIMDKGVAERWSRAFTRQRIRVSHRNGISLPRRPGMEDAETEDETDDEQETLARWNGKETD